MKLAAFLATIVTCAVVVSSAVFQQYDEEFDTARFCKVKAFCYSEWVQDPVFEEFGGIRAYEWTKDAAENQGIPWGPGRPSLSHFILRAKCREDGWVESIQIVRICQTGHPSESCGTTTSVDGQTEATCVRRTFNRLFGIPFGV